MFGYRKRSVAGIVRTARRATARAREARTIETSVRVCWVLMHCAITAVVFLCDTPLNRHLHQGHWGKVAPFGITYVATVVAYALICCSDPGYRFPSSDAHGPNIEPLWPRGASAAACAADQPLASAQPHDSATTPAARLPRSGSRNSVTHRGTATPRSARSLDYDSEGEAMVPLTGGDGNDVESGTTGLSPSEVCGKWCAECGAWQPLRTRHCRDCNLCVEKFDHHCMWVGNCVGGRNHGRFVTYLAAQLALLGFALHYTFVSLPSVSALDRGGGKALTQAVSLWAALAAEVLLTMFVAGVAGTHAWLIATNVTTYEMIRGEKLPYLQGLPAGMRPFSRGPSHNIAEVCGCKRQPEPERLPADLDARVEAYRNPQETWWKNRYWSCLG